MASIVAIAHLTWYIDGNQRILKFADLSGLVAVIGFLLISGYSIASSYHRKPEGYFIRRLLRIVPLYFLCVIGSALIPIFLDSPLLVLHRTFMTPSFNEWMGNLFFLQGITHSYLNTNPIVWTLSIEIFFYILTPILARSILITIFLLIVSSVAFLAYPYLNLGYYSGLKFGLSILFLGWSWLLGFWYFHQKQTIKVKFFVVIFGYTLIVLNGLHIENYWKWTWILTCTILIFWKKIPHYAYISKFLKILGDASYPLYLIHIPIYTIIYTFFPDILGLIYFMIVTLFAILIDRWIDDPIKIRCLQFINKIQIKDARYKS